MHVHATMNTNTTNYTNQASWNKSDLVKALLNAGADPLAADVNGMTALHLASLFGDFQSAEVLVATGKVDVNGVAETTLGGMVPLDCALECDRQVINTRRAHSGMSKRARARVHARSRAHTHQHVGPV